MEALEPREGKRRSLLLVVLLASAPCCSEADPSARSGPQNLLLICIDTLRADQLGFLGARPSITPNLDALAAGGVVFENAHSSASWTLPSVASLFTSLYSSTHGCWTFESRLAEEFVTLPEVFQDAGFDTAGIASHVFFDADYGLQQGFDVFDDELAHRANEPGWQQVTSPLVSEKAVRWLEERARSKDEDPFFLFLHYFDPHVPYVDHEAGEDHGTEDAQDALGVPQETRAELGRYRSEIAFTDRHVGSVLDALERAGLAERTAVVFFSDHGEAFYEHPGIRRHSYSLYGEELGVPLVVRCPGIAPRRVSSFVRNVDLFPTLVELFELSTPQARTGVSLVPLLNGTQRDSPALLAEIRLKDGYHWNGLVRERFKLLENVSKETFELYDLAADPRETRDLAHERPELVAELEEELRARIQEAKTLGERFGPAQSVEHTEEELEKLRRLGYSGKEEGD